MQLTELKKMPVEQLIELGEECGIANASRAKRQDIVFGILKSKAKNGEDIEGEGVLEILQDGFGFLRSPDSSYLAGPDDIYVSPSQIRRFGLRTGDTIKGKIRSPKDGERYFAILKIEEINFEQPDKTKNNSTPRIDINSEWIESVAKKKKWDTQTINAAKYLYKSKNV